MKYLLIAWMLNQLAGLAFAQLEYQVQNETFVETSPIEWSGSLAVGTDAQFFGIPGGNITFNLDRSGPDSTTELFAGGFFFDHESIGNLDRDRFNHLFLDLRQERPIWDSKWQGFLQANLDALMKWENRMLASGGVGFSVFHSKKADLKFRAGVGGYVTDRRRDERFGSSGNANEIVYQLGGSWSFQIAERWRIYCVADFFGPMANQPNGHWDNPVLVNLGHEFFLGKSRRVGIRSFVITRYGDWDHFAWSANYGISLVSRF